VHPGIAADDFVLLWAGGIYEWFDPLSLIEAVTDLGDERVKLFFMGMAHPNPEVEQMPMQDRAVARAEALGVKDRLVFFNDGWVPYDDRVGYLLEADVGVSTHFRHIETAYAFRTRMLDYIWTRLPVLCTEGDTLADLVAKRGLGEVVPAEDPKAITAALRALRDADYRAICAEHLGVLADELRWERVAQPIIDFCRSPHHAPDRPNGGPPARPASEDEHVRAELERLQAFEHKVKSTVPYKALNKARAAIRKP
jgi:glycosyltransferase involved in cell wall biosynthesis